MKPKIKNMYFPVTLKFCYEKIFTWYSGEICRSWTQGVNDTHGWKHRPQVELVLYFEPVDTKRINHIIFPGASNKHWGSWESRLRVVSTSEGRRPSWFCAGRCPTGPSDERWAATRRRTAASSSRWAAPPAGWGSGPGTAALTRCSADPVTS